MYRKTKRTVYLVLTVSALLAVASGAAQASTHAHTAPVHQTHTDPYTSGS